MGFIKTRIIPILPATLLLAAVLFHTIVPGPDPYRCRAALETGQWIDPPNAKGDRMPFKKWQPDGCLFHQYTSADIRQCMEGRSIVLSGDSTTREVVYGLGRLLAGQQAVDDEAHMDVSSGQKPPYLYRGVPVLHSLHRFLISNNNATDPRWEGITREFDMFRQEWENPVSIKDQQAPAMIILGAGYWFVKPESNLTKQDYGHNLLRTSRLLGSKGHKDFITAPMDPIDGTGNLVFLAPPAPPVYGGHDPEPFKRSKSARRILALQEWLHRAAGQLNFSLAWAIPRLSLTQKETIDDPLGRGGWNSIKTVAETKALIYLNLRCNAKLDRQNGYPYTRTCCTDYGNKPLVQRTLVTIGLIYLIMCVCYQVRGLLKRYRSRQSRILNMRIYPFVMALLICYYADRTQMMAKGAKLWSWTGFTILCIACIAIALVTIRKSQQPRHRTDTLSAEAEQPFLSRDQTYEWKGWMQCVIIIYQWTDAEQQSLTLDIIIQLIVAAYLFQTGYGHTTFFLLKKDYSFKRVAFVLLRLNLLTCALAYVMNTEYMFYYASPLASFWFIIIYITMALCHRSLNDNILSPLIRWTFSVLNALFKIEWSAEDWESRIMSDLLIVYIGMLIAVANFTITAKLTQAMRYSMAFVALIVLWIYWVTCSKEFTSITDYQTWHPYTSFIPILAFITLRSIISPLREYRSKAMVWLGRCSLEAHALQFHILLAADTKGVLLIDAFKGDGSFMDRWRSLVFIVPVFLWISSMASMATRNLVNVILNMDPKPEALSKVSLSDILAKHDDEDPENEKRELFLLQSEAAPHHHSLACGARYMKRVLSRSFQSPPFLKFVFLLSIMGLLNLLTPSWAQPPIPDGDSHSYLSI
ncbi:hypothetical protein G7Z17_g4436 [Cylindrodendrum hubeiense]|uniref:Cas1p 10 TM acyl transferase domain-containing protein n=1 Tax=Cylindrodendrum hubeiense TaxID=595255 RepID=A0A9P5H8W8_9HYPO|nr:hypothetical protein G7Z17_g4436 [Cylindrodendrum hubeiense]